MQLRHFFIELIHRKVVKKREKCINYISDKIQQVFDAKIIFSIAHSLLGRKTWSVIVQYPIFP